MKKPTARQLEYYRWMLSYQRQHDSQAPSLRAITSGMGMASTAGTFAVMAALIKKGLVRRGPHTGYVAIETHT